MSKQYTCELCKKVFNQKIDFTRHKNKKNLCISLEGLQKINKIQEQKTDIRSTLINVFKSCLNILRDNEGLTGEKALRNMSYLLILKLIEPHLGNEIDIDNCKYYDFDSHFEPEVLEQNKLRLLNIVRFSNLAKEKDNNIANILDHAWNIILSYHPSTKNIFLRGKCFDIQRSSTFKKLINKLMSIDLTNTDYDILGNAYEEVIQDIMTGKVLGQFFTQPLIKKMMVKLIDPQIYPDGKIDSCGDPTMGTGGFLITYLQYILHQATIKNIKPDWEYIKTEGLYGKELEPDTYQLAVSNMLISSGHMFEHLERGDSIRDPITRKFDNVLANPPFGIKGLKYNDFHNALKEEYVPIKTDNAVSLFIQAIIYMLKIGGKCAIVLPDGQDLFSKTNATLIAVREYLMKTCDLKEIIYLPSGIFTYTSVKTCVFYFIKKKEGTDTIEIKYKTKHETGRFYKFSKTLQTTRVSFYDYNPYEDIKNLLVEVPIEKIANNLYSLNYVEYLEDEKEDYEEGVVVKTLGEVLGKKNNIFITLKDNINYNVVGLSSKGFSKISKQVFGKDIKIKRQQLCKTSQFAISKILNGCYGFINDETNGGIISSEYWLFDINEEIILKKYLYHIFEDQILCQLKKISNGLGIPRINQENFYKIKIPIPPLDIQSQIVEYLDFLYNANKTSMEKISELKKLNKYCLNNQKMFGKNEIKTLKESLGKKNNIFITLKDNINYSVVGLSSKGFSKISKQVYGKDIKMKRQQLCKTSQFAISKILNGCYGFINDETNGGIISSEYWLFDIDEEIILKKYLYYIFEDQILSQLKKISNGLGIPRINQENFYKLKIHIPSLNVQGQLVDYCESNDRLIDLLTKEIENNKKQTKMCLDSIIVKSNGEYPTEYIIEDPMGSIGDKLEDLSLNEKFTFEDETETTMLIEE